MTIFFYKVLHRYAIYGALVCGTCFEHSNKTPFMQNVDLSFLQLKIANIGTALFYCDANSPLPFSTYIITALKLDEEGSIWFFISRGQKEDELSNRPFGAQLEFYRKGYPFSMKINGEAQIADIRENMPDLIGKGINLPTEVLSNIILVKVKLEKVMYKDLKTPGSFQLLNTVSGWLKNMLQPVAAQWQAAIS